MGGEGCGQVDPPGEDGAVDDPENRLVLEVGQQSSLEIGIAMADSHDGIDAKFERLVPRALEGQCHPRIG